MWLCFPMIICMLKKSNKVGEKIDTAGETNWNLTRAGKGVGTLLPGNTQRHYTERVFLRTTEVYQHSPAYSASKCLELQVNFSTTETELTGLEPTVMPRNTWTRTLNHWGQAVWREESCSGTSVSRLCLPHWASMNSARIQTTCEASPGKGQRWVQDTLQSCCLVIVVLLILEN